MKTSRTIAAVASAAALALLATTVSAGGHERGEDEEHGRGHHERGRHGRERDGSGRATRETPIDPTYAKECGACHVAFPPHLLPAASWTKLMAGLDRHFGENAELDPEAQAALERWLVARAGGTREGGAPLRLTETDRFRREHRKVRGAATRPSIRSMANCAACHPGAERWDFEEDRVKIPPG